MSDNTLGLKQSPSNRDEALKCFAASVAEGDPWLVWFRDRAEARSVAKR